ncbi:MAG: phage tail protein [Sphingomonadales bacterium]|nr:phage tail protein [Sphingomonadales bacterium]
MSDPFIAEIRMVAFNFAPRGWMLCNGQLLPIQQYTAVFSILGTTYGGNGQTNFALPNFQGRVPVGMGSGPGLAPVNLGEVAGTESVTLLSTEMPNHGHTLNCGVLTPQNGAQNVAVPTTQAMFGLSGPNQTYADSPTPAVSFNPAALALSGGNQPHENRQPYRTVNFVIAVQGIFPPRN